MPKEEWGTKRVCPTTGKRFYDLNRDPVVSPYTGEVVTLDTGKNSRTMLADKADKDEYGARTPYCDSARWHRFQFASIVHCLCTHVFVRSVVWLLR